MKSIHPLLGVAILFTGAMLASWGIITLSNLVHPSAPAQRSDHQFHSAPPPGYAIQTNGQGQWRWFRTQHGDRDSWTPMDSRQDAVESAWIWYNYDHAEKQTWRLDTPPPDPNAGLIQPFSHIGVNAESAR